MTGEIKHLNNSEAITKLKELAEDIGTCMFCTELTQTPFNTRPMALREVDEQGNEIDPRQELIDKILEYKKYKEAAAKMAEMEAERMMMIKARCVAGDAGLALHSCAQRIGSVARSDLRALERCPRDERRAVAARGGGRLAADGRKEADGPAPR